MSLPQSTNPSFWTQTAVAATPGKTLQEEIRRDVTIIGAGITGLRAALELASSGASVALLDAHEPGWGASGRTGGQVNPLAHAVPEKIIAQLGNTFGPRMLESYINSGNELFDLITEHQLDCDSVQNGWLRGAHCTEAIKDLEAMHQGWSEYGLDISFIEGQALRDLSGTDAYKTATVVKSGGCIQPLSYSRELARVATEQGADIYSCSPAISVTPDNRQWQVTTPAGKVTSDWVLFCTNGYTDDTLKGLKQTIVPLISVQAVTRPLSDAEYNAILPEGHTLSDTRRVIYYCRKDNHNRLLFGSLGMSEQCNAADRKRLHKAIHHVFPQFSAADLDVYWGGRLAFTPEVLPHLHEPAPGILAGLGYNGRGVAMGTVMGRILAERVQGKAPEDLAIPTTGFKAFPFHGLHRLGVYSAIKYYELRDAIDTRTG
ncbi:NAD(P)/FAD-dependent oxidoreductase [Aliamphritea spongicola]|uniref:NAD(P)/FAD-dependent oxidoreductase n=1 Tax=Aliamphritea spongicola TaxID=707589 RepID=UPI00196A7DFB|nr:FAD-dependent oxidoreductase [Aliamphritea spongicola]MBN3561036.1 FAD-binding oxidoreductase [Aliamphritea spongicola]